MGAANTDNVIENNRVTGNGKADLANAAGGATNKFSGNRCTTSVPAGMC